MRSMKYLRRPQRTVIPNYTVGMSNLVAKGLKTIIVMADHKPMGVPGVAMNLKVQVVQVMAAEWATLVEAQIIMVGAEVLIVGRGMYLETLKSNFVLHYFTHRFLCNLRQNPPSPPQFAIDRVTWESPQTPLQDGPLSIISSSKLLGLIHSNIHSLTLGEPFYCFLCNRSDYSESQ